MSLIQLRPKVGVVVSAGKMMKTVKVRVAKQKWNKRIQKYYDEPYNILVSDPTQSVREGDVISCISGSRSSSAVRHVVTGIIAPMGPPLSERPPVPTESQRLAAKEADRATRDLKQAARGRKVAIERTVERRKLAEMTRLELQVEQAQIQKEMLERHEAQLEQRRQAAEMLVQYEMLDKNILEGFATRLSTPLEQQIPAKGVSLTHHIQEANSSLEQGRRFDSSIQKQLLKLEKELGPVLEKPQEQIRLETALPAIRLMILEAKFKVQRLEKYLEQIRGKEQELREADARLLQNAQKVTQPDDFKWVNLVKQLRLTENEKKTARFELHNTGPTTSAIRQQNASKKTKGSAPERTPKDGKAETTQVSKEPQISELPDTLEGSEKVQDTAEESKKQGGIFGWFGR